jgi:hypothetical protein
MTSATEAIHQTVRRFGTIHTTRAHTRMDRINAITDLSPAAFAILSWLAHEADHLEDYARRYPQQYESDQRPHQAAVTFDACLDVAEKCVAR